MRISGPVSRGLSWAAARGEARQRQTVTYPSKRLSEPIVGILRAARLKRVAIEFGIGIGRQTRNSINHRWRPGGVYQVAFSQVGNKIGGLSAANYIGHFPLEIAYCYRDTDVWIAA
jgi:hypothetical protein